MPHGKLCVVDEVGGIEGQDKDDDVDWDDDDYSDMENGQACIGPSFVIFYVVLVVIWGD